MLQKLLVRRAATCSSNPSNGERKMKSRASPPRKEEMVQRFKKPVRYLRFLGFKYPLSGRDTCASGFLIFCHVATILSGAEDIVRPIPKTHMGFTSMRMDAAFSACSLFWILCGQFHSLLRTPVVITCFLAHCFGFCNRFATIACPSKSVLFLRSRFSFQAFGVK